MYPEPSAFSARSAPDSREAWLILVVTGTLTLFTYLARADLLGTARPGGEWFCLSRPALSLGRHNLAAAVLLGVIPVLITGFLNGRSWRGLGLGGGRVVRGLVWLGVGIPTAVVLGKLSAGHPQVQAVYPLGSGVPADLPGFVRHALTQLPYYASWEILFRGILLYGLTPRFGFAGANAVQTTMSVLAHFGRPLSETLAALPAGLALGGVASHTGCVWYVIVIHYTAAMAQDWFLVH